MVGGCGFHFTGRQNSADVCVVKWGRASGSSCSGLGKYSLYNGQEKSALVQELQDLPKAGRILESGHQLPSRFTPVTPAFRHFSIATSRHNYHGKHFLFVPCRYTMLRQQHSAQQEYTVSFASVDPGLITLHGCNSSPLILLCGRKRGLFY